MAFDPVDTAQALFDEAARSAERMPIVRTGPREPLPRWLRILVLRRDRFECVWCRARGVARSLPQPTR